MNENRKWSKDQIRQLDTLIGRLESLQLKVGTRDASGDLSDAKTALIRALRKAENE